jgi:hypothetical protein
MLDREAETRSRNPTTWGLGGYVGFSKLEITHLRDCTFKIARTYIDPQSDSTVHEEYNVGFYVGYSPKPRENPIAPTDPPPSRK